MQFGLLTYHTDNLGDDIQSLAAAQFLPRVDVYLDRDHLSQYSGGPGIACIFGSWWKHNSAEWPPPDNIRPVFVGFHAAYGRLVEPCFAWYYRRHAPIGCRDIATRDAIRALGVEAYLSGCISLTLRESYRRPRDGTIHLVDTDVLLGGVAGIRSTHVIDPTLSPAIRLDLARKAVLRYAAAELVVTSRLHAFLPCLSLGTPVVHVGPRDRRFSGIDIIQQDMDGFATRLAQTCRKAVCALA